MNQVEAIPVCISLILGNLIVVVISFQLTIETLNFFIYAESNSWIESFASWSLIKHSKSVK